MAEDRIDSVIDRGAVQTEIDATKKEISDLVALIKSVKGTAIEISGAKSTAEYSALNKELQQYISLTNKAAAATAAQATGIKSVTDAQQQQNLTLQQNVELRKRIQNTVASYLASQKEDLALLKEGTITRAEYNQRLTESTIRIEQYKGKLKDINKEITQQTRTEKQLALEKQKNARIEQEANNKQIAILQKSIAQINKQSGAYAKLSAEYQAVALTAKNFNVQLGANNPLTIAATRNAVALADQLKAVDNTVGQNTRSVGDYSNSIAKTAGKAFGAVRTLANILPGIGIAGIFGAVFSGIGSLFDNTNKKADELKEKLAELIQPMEDIQDAAAAGASESIARVEALANAVLDQTLSYKERNRALDELKEINKNYFGDLTLETSKLGALKAAVDAYTEAIIAAAVVKGFESEIGKVSVELSKQITAYNKAGVEVDKYSHALEEAEALKKQRTYENNRGQITVLNEDLLATQRAQKNLNTAKKNLSTLGGGVSTLAGQMRELKTAISDAVKQSLGFKPLDDPKKTKEDKSGEKALKEAAALAERIRQAQFEQQKIFLQQQINFSQSQIENENLTLEERLQAVKNYTNRRIRLNNETAAFEAATEGKLAEEIALIETQRIDNNLKAIQDGADKAVKIKADEAKRIKEEAEKLSKALMAIAERLGKAAADAAEKAKKDREKRDKDELDAAKKLAEEKKKLQEKLASEITALAFTFLTANIEREKNALQEQLDDLEKTKAREIQLAGNNADQVAVIEARAQIQKEAIQRRARALDVKKAQFDKAQAIARIIQETAVAIVENLKNPVLIPLVAAIGAVQLATVLAQPIPKYKDGGRHGGGPMIVGDGGRAEGVQLPDGTIIKTPSRPTLMDAPAGTVIHKDYNQMLFNSTMTKPRDGKTAVIKDSNARVVKGLEKVEKAISKIPQSITTVQNVIRQRVRYGHSINDHIKRNLGK